jgi:cytoskeletal protein RodZ
VKGEFYMKKLWGVTIASILFLGLAGCGNSTAQQDSQTSSKSSHTEKVQAAKSKKASQTSATSTSTTQTTTSSSDQSSAGSSTASDTAAAATATTSSTTTTAAAQTDSNSSQAVSSQASSSQTNNSNASVTNGSAAIGVLSQQLQAKYPHAQYLDNGTTTYNGQTVFYIEVYPNNSAAPAAGYYVLPNGTVVQHW